MALPLINYDTDLLFYLRPLERPRFPLEHQTRESWRNYYDRVKVEVQLFHDETKEGVLKMLEEMIYQGHINVFCAFLKRYQTEHMEVNEFWLEYLRCVSVVKRCYESIPDASVVETIAEFAKDIDERKFTRDPLRFFERWMMILQRQLRSTPNIKLLKGLVNCLHQRLPIKVLLQREMNDVLVLKDDNRFGVFAKLNTLDTMRRLTVILVRHSPVFTNGMIILWEKERQEKLRVEQLRQRAELLRRYDLAQSELRRTLEGVTCLFCGSGDGHEFYECELILFLKKTGVLNFDDERQVCDNYGSPMAFESAPWCQSKELRAYLAVVRSQQR